MSKTVNNNNDKNNETNIDNGSEYDEEDNSTALDFDSLTIVEKYFTKVDNMYCFTEDALITRKKLNEGTIKIALSELCTIDNSQNSTGNTNTRFEGKRTWYYPFLFIYEDGKTSNELFVSDVIIAVKQKVPKPLSRLKDGSIREDYTKDLFIVGIPEYIFNNAKNGVLRELGIKVEPQIGSGYVWVESKLEYKNFTLNDQLCDEDKARLFFSSLVQYNKAYADAKPEDKRKLTSPTNISGYASITLKVKFYGDKTISAMEVKNHMWNLGIIIKSYTSVDAVNTEAMLPAKAANGLLLPKLGGKGNYKDAYNSMVASSMIGR